MPLFLPRYTFINGPPGSGKSTLASLICKEDPDVWRESFANPIREMLYATFFPEEGFSAVSTLDLRDQIVKERPFPFPTPTHVPFTFRKVMISFSEEWMKPMFGKEIFGTLALRRCNEQEHFYQKFVFDDSGFAPEAEYIIRNTSESDCLLIRLHRIDCTFKGDSRGYIELPCRAIDLHNNATPEELLGSLDLALGGL